MKEVEALHVASIRAARPCIYMESQYFTSPVIAAELAPDRVRAILGVEGMHAVTEHTITSVDAYLAELEKVKVDGYGVDDLEAQLDGRCVAVPLLGLQVAAGLSVSAPANRLPRELVPAVVAQLQRSAVELVKGYESILP